MATDVHYDIYTLSEPDTGLVRYVGLTSDYKGRMRAHFKCTKRYRVNDWIKSVKKKGLLPVHEIIDTANGLEEARKKEIEYVKLFKSVGAILTNLTAGGEGTKGYKPSEETRRKISEAVKGFKHTEEAKRKISEASKRFMTGRKIPKESIEKMANALKGKPSWNKGKKASEEIRKKLSEVRKSKLESGEIKVWNKDTKGKQTAWNKGNSKYDEAKIFELKNQGLTNKQIAEELNCSRQIIYLIVTNRYFNRKK